MPRIESSLSASNESCLHPCRPQDLLILRRKNDTLNSSYEGGFGASDKQLWERHETINEKTSSWKRVVAYRLLKEIQITYFLLVDNLIICLLPATLFTVAASLRSGLSLLQLSHVMGPALWLNVLYVYTFDTLNQIEGVAEDAVSKPHRPVPAGLTNASGLFWRFLLAEPLYLLSGWCSGVMPWVLLWQATVLARFFWSTPQTYLFWKTPYNVAGSVAMLTIGWRIVAPLDEIAWTWILVVSIYMPLPLIFEDIRDMKGDRMIGRRTPALVFGPQPIRYWFAAFMIALPAVAFHFLASTSGAPLWRQVVGTAAIGALALICMARALILRDVASDRITYQLFTFLWSCLLGLGVFLWWP